MLSKMNHTTKAPSFKSVCVRFNSSEQAQSLKQKEERYQTMKQDVLLNTSPNEQTQPRINFEIKGNEENILIVRDLQEDKEEARKTEQLMRNYFVRLQGDPDYGIYSVKLNRGKENTERKRKTMLNSVNQASRTPSFKSIQVKHDSTKKAEQFKDTDTVDSMQGYLPQNTSVNVTTVDNRTSQVDVHGEDAQNAGNAEMFLAQKLLNPDTVERLGIQELHYKKKVSIV